jgi:hypothetical protein
VALERAYCGVAAAEMPPWLTVSVVDDLGRMVALRHVSDDPDGYAELGSLLADVATAPVPIAIDNGDRLIAQLFAAAHRPLAIADAGTLSSFAERFSDDSSYDRMVAPMDQRRAIGLARALQAGALYPTSRTPSWNMDEFRPVLVAHTAVTAGRQAAAGALRDVLRELFPAALRAYPDPAAPLPLRVLELLPEPGMLGPSPSSQQRESALVAELTHEGVADPHAVTAAIAALRTAVEESLPRFGDRNLGGVVADTVRAAVTAVLACDSAASALVASLSERLAGPARSYAPANVPTSPAPRRLNGPAVDVPADRYAPRQNGASAAAAGVAAAAVADAFGHAAASPYAAAAPAVPSPLIPPPIPTPRSGDYSGYSGSTHSYAESPSHQAAPSSPASPPSRDYALPGYPAPGGRSDWPTNPPVDDYGAGRAPDPWSSAPRPADDPMTSTLAFSMDPLNAPLSPPANPMPRPVSPPYAPPVSPPTPYTAPLPNHSAPPASYSSPPASFSAPPASYSAPPASYSAPPASYSAPPASYSAPPASYSAPPASYSAPVPSQSPPPASYSTPAPPQSAPPSYSVPPSHSAPSPSYAPPEVPSWQRSAPADDPLTGALRPSANDDGDLLIFSDLPEPSAWFTQMDEMLSAAEPPSWGHRADDGWRAAGNLINPSKGADTRAGLPRRVPQANLVPGAVQPPANTLRIVRDAGSIARHTEGYFRGWRRGQEIGGFAVGQRDRAAWEFNRDERAREMGYGGSRVS